MQKSAVIAAFTVLFFVFGSVAAAEKGKTETSGGAASGTAAASGSGDLSGTATASGTAPSPAPTTGTAPAPAPTTGAQPAPVSACALINCSGHGLCIEQDGRPMCACNDGFAPDGINGLSCLPLPQTTAVLVTPSVTAQDLEREAALKQFYAVLPGYPAERDYSRYARLKAYGRFSGTFPDYMAGRFHGQKAGGIVMTSVGGALTVAAAMFLAIGINPENFLNSCGETMEGDYYDGYVYVGNCDEERVPFLVFGNIFAVAAVTMYSVGIPQIAIGSSRLKKVNQLRTVKAAKARGLSDPELSVTRNEKTDSWGLVTGFKF